MAPIATHLDICQTEEVSWLRPRQTAPILPDRGVYPGLESTFYRVLSEHAENKRRSRSKPPKKKVVTAYSVNGPNQVWVTDISWLKGPVLGLHYYLYFILDLYSRKFVAYEVHESESSEHLANLVKRTPLTEGASAKVPHSDNGFPIMGTVLFELYDQQLN